MIQRLTILAMVLCLASVGCKRFGMDSDTGKDGKRADAKPINLNEPVNDSVDSTRGDHNDWRSFSVKKRGSVKIIIAFDQWKEVQAKITLRNAFGASLKAFKFTGMRQLEEIGPFMLDKGDYFVQVTALSGGSVYTIKLRYKTGGVETIKVPRPE